MNNLAIENTKNNRRRAKLTIRIKDNKYKKKSNRVTYIDFYKAYDSVEHWTIRQTLEFYQINQDFIMMIESMYREIQLLI